MNTMVDLTCNGEFPLARFSDIYTQDMQEMYELFTRLVRDHDILSYGDWSGLTELHYAPLRRMTVSAVKLGTDMVVNIKPASDSSLVFTSANGTFDIIIDGTRFIVNSNKAIFVPPGLPFTLEGSSETTSIMLDIKLDYLQSLLNRNLDFETILTNLNCNNRDTDSDYSSTVAELLCFLRREIQRGTPQLKHEGYLECMEELVARSILCTNSGTRPGLEQDSTALPRALRKVLRYIEANAHERLTLETLAEIAATSPRSLVRNFRRYMRSTPVAYLKSVRLQRAHIELSGLLPGESSVTEIAHKWGFYNLGRFASLYRQRFGENPADTLNRVQ